MTVAEYPRNCAADVLEVLKLVSCDCASIADAILLGWLTNEEWAACLALYRRKELGWAA